MNVSTSRPRLKKVGLVGRQIICVSLDLFLKFVLFPLRNQEKYNLKVNAIEGKHIIFYVRPK